MGATEVYALFFCFLLVPAATISMAKANGMSTIGSLLLVFGPIAVGYAAYLSAVAVYGPHPSWNRIALIVIAWMFFSNYWQARKLVRSSARHSE